ncbi:MAG TPA: M24 family metallopeptidase [Syntrophorhabdales bacterium]|nr:M24 family metallopeptidase [Syntrophorhabdales bacterium]
MTGASLQERDRRWNSIRRSMEEAGLNGLLVVSDGHLERRGSIRYIADVSAKLLYGYVVFPLNGEPILICNKPGWIKDRRPVPFRGGWIIDSEPYVPAIVAAIRELNLDKGPIGIEGDFLPAPVYQALLTELPDVMFSASAIVHELKMIKSAEELQLIEKGVEMVDKAYEACVEFVCTRKSNLTWNDITAEVCRVLYRLGSEDIGGYPLSHATDIMKGGDIYNLYPEPQAPGGHWMQFGRLIALGEPDKELRPAWDLDTKAQELAAEKLKPGNTGGDVARAINDALKGSAYTGASRGSGHGVGLDIIERPFISLDDETVLKPGMVVAIHPVFDPHPALFEACADMFVVTEGKPRKLSRIAPGIAVV